MRLLNNHIVFLSLLICILGTTANAKVVAKCKGLMLPDEIKNGEISWQVMEEFQLTVESTFEGLSARGGHKDNPVLVMGNELEKSDFSAEQAQAILAQFQMIDEESGLAFNVFGINPHEIAGGVYYNIGKTANEQDRSGMGLFVFRNANKKTVAKLVQAGWLLGMCQK